MNKQDITRWILDRLKEKGTWIALASLVGLFGIQVAPDDLEIVGAGIIVIAGIIGMGRNEDA